ncbi:MAG: hypothetical protein Q7R49_01850 [Candidatus Daviesbacteria bacterium]|nr:hypothetical protein [Candidatus Daviesbacteria bacterium]
MLDSLENNKTNIHNLNIEEPKPRVFEPTFDPDRDIPADAWENIGKVVGYRLERFQNFPSEWASYLRIVSEVALLSPERKDILHFSEATTFGLSDAINNSHAYENKVIALGQIAVIDSRSKRLFGNLLGVNEQFYPNWDLVGRDIKEQREKVGEKWLEDVEEGYKITSLLITGMGAKLYSPEKFKEFESHFDDNFFNLISTELNYLKYGLELPVLLVEGYARLMALGRVMYPDKYPAIKPEQDDWEQFNNELKRLAGAEEWDNYVTLALHMKILAAGELEFSEERGLEIIPSDPKKPLTEEIPALPEMRKF